MMVSILLARLLIYSNMISTETTFEQRVQMKNIEMRATKPSISRAVNTHSKPAIPINPHAITTNTNAQMVFVHTNSTSRYR